MRYKRPCKNGEMCEQLTSGNCLYYHPPEHTRRNQLYNERTIGREEKMLRGLQYQGEIKLPKTDLESFEQVGIEVVRALSSFNKIADDEIAVPGVPPRFRPLKERLKLVTDHNNKFVERNYPTYTHSFEPLVRSVQALNPGFTWTNTDIVTNASNLRKMFNLFRNQVVEYDRFDLTLENNILFLSKWTKDPHLNSSVGHGSGFEKATCIYEDDEDERLKNSASHHRVIDYRFGGLQMVVQSEVDAYQCKCHCPGATASSSVDHTLLETMSAMTIDKVPSYHDTASHQRTNSADSAISFGPRNNLFNPPTPLSDDTPPASPVKLARDPTPPSPPPTPVYPPSIADKPPLPSPNDPSPPTTPFNSTFNSASISSPTLLVQPIPAPCLVEVKTHKVNNKPLFNAEAQLFFCQVTQLYIAKNNAGVFDVWHMGPVQDMRGEMKKWVGGGGESEDFEEGGGVVVGVEGVGGGI